MEETEVLENQNVPQTDKMKPASAHCEHNELYILDYSHSTDAKESLGQISLEQKNINAVRNLKKQQSHVHVLGESRAQLKQPENTDENTKPAETEQKMDISTNEQENKDIVLTNSSESKEQCQEDRTLTMENARKSYQLIAEESFPSPKEARMKEELQESKEPDTHTKSEQVRIDELDQMAASTSSATQEPKMEKPNEITPGKGDNIDPRDKIREEIEEYFRGIQALEVKTLGAELNAREAETILRAEQQRKTWKGMLLAMTLSSSASSSGKPPKTAAQAILQRTAKAEFKRKMYVLKENYNYRLELIKQLKNDLKNNYKSEAQQLHIDYHSIKNQTPNSSTSNEMPTPNTEQEEVSAIEISGSTRQT
ncbi:uncharacterized protein LOC6541102 isoform X1 [Drosophila erecta]|uniref:uncharacterized protein LOC6541102 isoform X1 n=1 Tax=Drosophila erecta TaxID=7220 RepID=UPI000F05D1F6|nr:uncharacterized protein LOC6541102 isoform X1 [Drosophila erecta]